MKQTKYLLLLILMVSCVSGRNAQRRSSQTIARQDVPATITVPTPIVAEEEKEAPEPVISARPLVSRVHRFPQGTWQAAKQQALDSLCQSPMFETSQLGLYVYDLTDGQPVYAVNAAHRMRPASCQKVVTAITALHYLKGSYKFTTDFRITGKVNGRVLNGDLIVVGGMDPLVSFDDLLQAANSIKQKLGIDAIEGVILYDLFIREDTPLGWGWCWDDDYGPLSALLVDGKDTFEQNWIKALAQAGIKHLKAGNLKASALKGNTAQATSVYTIRHSIDEVLMPMMKESNNIFAECLFYQVAASTGRKAGGHKQVATRTDELMKQIGLNPEQYKVADGSGLSLYNYVSAEMLVAMLGYAWRTQAIREHLLPSLPIAGYDGTLQKRMIGTEAEGNVRAKTGTVTGVSSLAGYLTTKTNHVLAFAIINQGVVSSAMGRTFQDKVCQELCR